MAKELIERFHSVEDADYAEKDFVMRFKRQEIPEEMDEYELEACDGIESIAQVLKGCGLVASTSEGMRMIRQGAVKINGVKVEDVKQELIIGEASVYQVGKRKFARIKIS